MSSFSFAFSASARSLAGLGLAGFGVGLRLGLRICLRLRLRLRLRLVETLLERLKLKLQRRHFLTGARNFRRRRRSGLDADFDIVFRGSLRVSSRAESQQSQPDRQDTQAGERKYRSSTFHLGWTYRRKGRRTR